MAISEGHIRQLVEDKIELTGHFLVSLTVSSSNAINIEIDHVDGMPIGDCVQISRHIEGSLDREIEDFELKVSSPGLDKPLRVLQQYHKNVGRDVDVLLEDGRKIKGLLKEVNEEEIIIYDRKKKRIEGRKAKYWVETNTPINFNQIKETKVVISFKPRQNE